MQQTVFANNSTHIFLVYHSVGHPPTLAILYLFYYRIYSRRMYLQVKEMTLYIKKIFINSTYRTALV